MSVRAAAFLGVGAMLGAFLGEELRARVPATARWRRACLRTI
jgi:uncharacterized membrane protein YfcA